MPTTVPGKDKLLDLNVVESCRIEVQAVVHCYLHHLETRLHHYHSVSAFFAVPLQTVQPPKPRSNIKVYTDIHMSGCQLTFVAECSSSLDWLASVQEVALFGG